MVYIHNRNAGKTMAMPNEGVKLKGMNPQYNVMGVKI